MRNIAPKLCGLLRKPKLGKIFVNQKLKLHNGACHSSHYANIMILTLIALFVTKPLIIRYKKGTNFQKKKKIEYVLIKMSREGPGKVLGRSRDATNKPRKVKDNTEKCSMIKLTYRHT